MAAQHPNKCVALAVLQHHQKNIPHDPRWIPKLHQNLSKSVLEASPKRCQKQAQKRKRKELTKIRVGSNNHKKQLPEWTRNLMF